MPSYAHPRQLVEDHLDQLRDTLDEYEPSLQRCLDVATEYIDNELGYTFTNPPAAVIIGNGTDLLKLPRYLTGGTVTGVSASPSTYGVPDYSEQDGYLIVTNSDGVILRGRTTAGIQGYYHSGAWIYGVAYTVTATFRATPELIKRLCCELARDLWYERGGRRVTEEGAIPDRSALTDWQQSVLAQYSAERVDVGIY